jgi:hypothetical protein
MERNIGTKILDRGIAIFWLGESASLRYEKQHECKEENGPDKGFHWRRL